MLLHHISNTLLHIYMKYDSAKDIWNTLNKKYGGDDAASKRYAISRWLSFKLEEDKPIIDQIHEYENLCFAIASEGKYVM